MTDPLLSEISDKIDASGLSLPQAAKQIGVTVSSLKDHLSGEHVRSDSMAKYRLWLVGSSSESNSNNRPAAVPSAQPPFNVPQIHAPNGHDNPFQSRFSKPPTPYRTVDLFSGCGGLSLGFELTGGGDFFKTVLAIDNNEMAVKAFNGNIGNRDAGLPTCRNLDITDFLNEAEILGFYLDHYARHESDDELSTKLQQLRPFGIGELSRIINHLDGEFLDRLAELRQAPEYVADYKRLSSRVMGQTSVLGFHSALKLPCATSRRNDLGSIIWADGGQDLHREFPVSPNTFDNGLTTRLAEEAEREWTREIEQLKEKSSGSGKGQLESSASRVSQFVAFMESDPVKPIRRAWVEWRSKRNSVRESVFSNEESIGLLEGLYSDNREVSVLLGGPPCQGFSRIGRGKIRSLRDGRVQVQEDSESGDARNKLFEQYVLVLSALKPSVFLFENVRHFKSALKTREGTYSAAEILSRSAKEMSGGTLSYDVTSSIIDSSKHLIPQKRERYFMAGVRTDFAGDWPEVDSPSQYCVSLPERLPIPLKIALTGLEDAWSIGLSKTMTGDLSRTTIVESPGNLANPNGDSAKHYYSQWINGNVAGPATTADAHCFRRPRGDDGTLFSLLGPGQRWMDYRVERSDTLLELSEVIKSARNLLRQIEDLPELQLTPDETLSEKRLDRLESKLDGSLALRLILENIKPLPGELSHHLLSDAYMTKRDGNHGDWMARMDPEKPSKTIVSHMAKDTYQYIHPTEPRTLSVRESARIQSFPDNFSFGMLSLTDAFRAIGNAVPPLLGYQVAQKILKVLQQF